MRRVQVAVVVAVLVALAAAAHTASGSPTRIAPAPALPAAAWYLEGPDGAVLAEHHARERRPMASITKLMTAIVTLEHARLSDVVIVSRRAARVGGETLYLRAGEQMTVAQLLRGMLVRSGNDAAEALALYVGDGSQSRFVALMNTKARELGLTDTTYVNPHGLDAPGHLSSARDTTRLIRYALGIPFIRDALGRASVSSGGEVFPTTDDLLTSWPPLLGGKTGHTANAGWSEAAAARGRGVTVYGSVLGSTSETDRDEALESLLRYGLDRYRRVAAVVAGRVYATAATSYGRPAVELVARRQVLRTVPDRTALVERVVAPTVVALPVRAGQPLGRIEVYAGDRVLASAPLVAAGSESEPGLFGKAAWYVRRTAHRLWGLVT
jgi:D-alanyl-D-alanine carboxypeptidase (penicillin-binding protein 5/6)